MKIMQFFRSLVGTPMDADATVNSAEFAEMKRANEMVIQGANTITTEILKIERSLKRRGK